MTVQSHDDAAAQILSSGVPVLMLDTCIILDIVRAPVRKQMHISDIAAVHSLLKAASHSPQEICLVITEQVHHEFLNHINSVESETKRELRAVTERITEILERMTAVSPAQDIPDTIDLLSLGFPAAGRKLADAIIQTSIVPADDDQLKVKAFDRVKKANPPATKAKQSVEDCLITESCLRLADELHRRRFSKNIVFATSNSKDYQQNHGSLHPGLRVEFAAVGLKYSPCWSAALHELQ